MSLYGIVMVSFLPALLYVAVQLKNRRMDLLDCALSLLRSLLAVSAVAFVRVPDALIPAALVPFETALAEEAAKLLAISIPLLVRMRKDPGAPVPVRAIYRDALLIGLSFAAFENIWYALSSGSGILLARTLTAVPLHAACALIGCGAAVSMTRGEPTNTDGARPRVRMYGFLAAVVLHGGWNWCMERSGFFVLPGFALLASAVIYAYVVWMRSDDPS